MQTKKIKKSISATIAKYRAAFACISETDFILQPPKGGWSYSEVYSHIFDASLLSLRAIGSCSSGKAEEKPTHFLVKLILLYGAFPPNKKYKVPKTLIDRVKKISKADADALMGAVEKQLSSSENQVNISDKRKKIKHPRLGYLNAKQWFRFTEIHLKHHLKQLNRIQNSFSQRI